MPWSRGSRDYRLEARMIGPMAPSAGSSSSVTLCQTPWPHAIAVFADLTERKQAEANSCGCGRELEQQGGHGLEAISRGGTFASGDAERGAMQQQLWQNSAACNSMLEHTSNALPRARCRFHHLEAGTHTALLGWHASEMLGRPPLRTARRRASPAEPCQATAESATAAGTTSSPRRPASGQVVPSVTSSTARCASPCFARHHGPPPGVRGDRAWPCPTAGHHRCLPVTISMVSPEGVTCSPARPCAATSGSMPNRCGK